MTTQSQHHPSIPKKCFLQVFVIVNLNYINIIQLENRNDLVTDACFVEVVVTVDRYIAVCRPLKSHLRTVSRAKTAVLAVIALSILYNMPLFFERHTVELDCAGIRFAIVRQTALRSHYIYFVIYKTALFFLFRTAGPLACLTALNVRLMVALQELRRRRRRLKV